MSRINALVIERFLACCIASAVVFHIWHVFEFGYLFVPFFYEPSDTFMDWFNTVFWAHDPGRYDNWQTIYPPLSFSIMRLLSIKSCYADSEGLTARDCDWVGTVVLLSVFFLNSLLIFLVFWRIDRTTVVPRWFALSFGLPMLHALERGNILLMAFTGVLLAFGPLLASARLRWLALAVAINLKVYLLAILFPQLLKRRWRWFEGALLATILVYIVSFLHIGDGSPGQIIGNILAATDVFEAGSFLDGWYAVTYQPFMAILQSNYIPIISIIGSDAVEALLLIIPTILRFTQGIIAVAAICVWLRPEAVPTSMVTLLGLLMALVTSETSGYTEMFLVLFVFNQRWQGIGRPCAILMCYILCIPADIIIDRLTPGVAESYLAGGRVTFEFVLTLGPFIRPLLVQIAACAISATVINMVRRDFAQGNGDARSRFGTEYLGPRRTTPSQA